MATKYFKDEGGKWFWTEKTDGTLLRLCVDKDAGQFQYTNGAKSKFKWPTNVTYPTAAKGDWDAAITEAKAILGKL